MSTIDEAMERLRLEMNGKDKVIDVWQPYLRAVLDEIMALRSQRTKFDCRYTLGSVADFSGSHCPLNSPCQRCELENLSAVNRELVAGVRSQAALARATGRPALADELEALANKHGGKEA